MEENRIGEDFYEDNAFWREEDCIWSTNYKSGVILYPDWPKWEEIRTMVVGIAIQKYVSAVLETDWD